MPVDHPRAQAAVRELLCAIGEDPDREGLRETPARVARALGEFFAGLDQRPEDILSTTFDIDLRDLPVTAAWKPGMPIKEAHKRQFFAAYLGSRTARARTEAATA